jgi:hypothetical protein
MALLTPTNFRPSNAAIDGVWVAMTYDDPNGTATAKGAVYAINGTSQVLRSLDVAARSVVVKGGEQFILEIVNAASTQTARSTVVTAPPATLPVPPPPPPPPPPVLTAKQHLEAAMGATYAAGTQLGFITVTKTIQQDGSIS